LHRNQTTNALLVGSITLTPTLVEPLYQQLFQQLRQLIVTGRLQPSTRLPSSRQLALDLKVSRTTSVNAYQQLQSEGLLLSRQGAGIYVNHSLSKSTQAQTPQATNKALPTQLEASPKVSISFNSGPDVTHFPFPLWARCLARVWRQPEPSLLHDLHIGGYQGLRQALCHYLYVMRGVQCDAQQIIITAGQRDSLSLVSKVLMQAGDGVYMENPGYPLQRQVIDALGLRADLLEVDNQGVMLPSLSRRASSRANKLAIIGPSQQYPLGIAMSGPRKLAWLSYAQSHNCWLLEDDYDSEYVYERRRTDALMSLDATGKVILLGSFSKLMFHGFRLGYLVLPKALVANFLLAQEQLGGMASLHIQPALSQFLSERSFNAHLGRMRRLYQARRDTLCQLIKLHLDPWLSVQPPDAGMHLLAYCRNNLDDVALEAELRQQGVLVHALSKHYANTDVCAGRDSYADIRGFVMGFSGCNEQQLEENVLLFRQVLEHSPIIKSQPMVAYS